MRQRIARLYTESETLRVIRMRTLAAALTGSDPGPGPSIRKALADRHGQHVMDVAKDLAGTAGMLVESGPCGDDDPVWSYGYLFARALTIGGGTTEVQLNIIGERILGLPQDPAGGRS
jgi:alkylation response protein AidB-like acyl-CoA dehydrogenase